MNRCLLSSFKFSGKRCWFVMTFGVVILFLRSEDASEGAKALHARRNTYTLGLLFSLVSR